MDVRYMWSDAPVLRNSSATFQELSYLLLSFPFWSPCFPLSFNQQVVKQLGPGVGQAQGEHCLETKMARLGSWPQGAHSSGREIWMWLCMNVRNYKVKKTQPAPKGFWFSSVLFFLLLLFFFKNIISCFKKIWLDLYFHSFSAVLKIRSLKMKVR